MENNFVCNEKLCKYPDGRCSGGCVFFKDRAIVCPIRKEWDIKVRMDCEIKKAHVEGKYDFSDYKGTDSNVSILEELSDNYSHYLGSNFYVWGRNSTQKTTMLKAYARHLIKNNPIGVFSYDRGYTEDFNYVLNDKYPFLVRFISMSGLLNILRRNADMNSDIRESTMFDMYENESCRVLIIDESFDSKKILSHSDYDISLLDSFIRKRMESPSLTTFFISNTRPENIGSAFGESLRSFICRECELLEFNSKIEDTMKKFTIRRA